MNIVFRADASIEIGSGHVMRCLTLADALTEHGHRCVFISRDHLGNLCDFIVQRGYESLRLPMHKNSDCEIAHASWLGATQSQDAEDCLRMLDTQKSPIYDVLVVDHYALDEKWEKVVGKRAKKTFVIDDLADRVHYCDMLLDQNLGREQSDYQKLIPAYCRCLIGPKYALLRPEFAELREYSLNRRRNSPQLKNLLVTLGGVDKDNVTGKVLTALKSVGLPLDIEITVVMGATAPHLHDVQEKAKQLSCKTEVVVNVTDMASRMAEADVAIGAAGSTSWERCCMGLPTLMFVLADNQRDIAHSLQSASSVLLVKDVDTLNDCIDFINNMEKLTSMVSASATVTDGKGITFFIDLIEEN